jgi:O-antigen/teichoic acid export membrane protein
MTSLRSIFLKNAFANVIGGAGTALFNLLLPALVVRHLDKLEFSVWTLSIQVIAYVHLFGLGLQTVVTYQIAKANANGDEQAQRDSIAASRVLARYFAGVAAVAVVALMIAYPFLFDQVPAQLVGEFRFCIGLLGMSAVSQLLALVPIGAFFGLHRNIIPVAVQLGTRCLSLLTAIVALAYGANLLTLSTCVALCSALLLPVMLWMGKRSASSMFQSTSPAPAGLVPALFKDCAGLAVWNVAMLLVNGIDIVVVGHFSFEKVAAYSLAATAITIFVGVLQAMLNPLVAMGSALSVSAEQHAALRRLLIRASQYCAAFLVAAIVIYMFAGTWLLSFWVGQGYVSDVNAFLLVLLVAHAARNLMAPYAVLLVAVGMQRKALFPALVEGIVNLVASVALASRLGAIGVAYGTLIGAFAGVAASTIFVVNQTGQLVESRARFVRSVLAIPMCSLVFLFFYSIN